MKEIKLPIEEIIKEYEIGTSQIKLAEKYGVAQGTISIMIRRYYKRNSKERPRQMKSATTIVEYLNKGLTIEQIIEIASKNKVVIPNYIIARALERVEKQEER